MMINAYLCGLIVSASCSLCLSFHRRRRADIDFRPCYAALDPRSEIFRSQHILCAPKNNRNALGGQGIWHLLWPAIHRTLPIYRHDEMPIAIKKFLIYFCSSRNSSARMRCSNHWSHMLYILHTYTQRNTPTNEMRRIWSFGSLVFDNRTFFVSIYAESCLLYISNNITSYVIGIKHECGVGYYFCYEFVSTFFSSTVIWNIFSASLCDSS